MHLVGSVRVYCEGLREVCDIHWSPLPCKAVDRIGRVELELSDADQTYVDNVPYRSWLGALLYLSMNTRPDRAYAVGLLSRFDSKPTLTASYLITYLMQYERGTVSLGIQFSGSMFDMHIFTDWVSDSETRRSTIG